MKKYEPIEKYVKTVYDILTDIEIWKSILGNVVDEYEIENEKFGERDLLSSIFTIFDLEAETGHGKSKVFQNTAIRITTKNIGEQKESFFRWVINSSILKIYNSVEILLQSVILEEFLNQNSSNFGKKHSDIVKSEINEFFKARSLGKPDTKNNRHLIQYLKIKSASIEAFMKNPVRIDLKSSWENFFELISILRNVIAHNGMLIERDTLNNINNSNSARDVFERYFSTNLKVDNLIILNPNQEQIPNFINKINEFAVNIVKFAKQEGNLEFCSFK